MASLGETLLLIEKRKTSNLDLYVVLSDNKTEGEEVTFLKQDDAFEFARTLLNGRKPVQHTPKRNRGGKREIISDEAIKKRREYIYGFFSNPSTVKALYQSAKKSIDRDISTVPFSSWSGIVSRLCKRKKVAMIHRIGVEGVYKTVSRG